MPAPLAKGIIIAASIVVAAGIAIYESPQVRAWVDQSRRKIAIALHNLGDDIQPRRASESSDDFELRKKRREDLVRRNRNEFIRRAREEGVAVDLDELAKIGTENVEMAERRSRADRSKSFDTIVGKDGMLKNETTATGNDISDKGLKKRGAAGFAAGSAAAATMANPFTDEHVLFDVGGDDDEAPSPKPFTYIDNASRESTATLQATSPAAAAPLIDITPEPHTNDDADLPTQSFYSFTSSSSHPELDPEIDTFSTGTLTPRSDRSYSHSITAGPDTTADIDIDTNASIAPSTASDIAVLLDADADAETDTDTRSEAFSESGFTDAEGFSELGHEDVGVMTPSSWTDVGSGDESE